MSAGYFDLSIEEIPKCSIGRFEFASDKIYFSLGAFTKKNRRGIWIFLEPCNRHGLGELDGDNDYCALFIFEITSLKFQI